MAYNNPFIYNKDYSVKDTYSFTDLSLFKPIYGSSVSYESRLNFLQTSDNKVNILPVSENNLIVKYNLIFLLNDQDSGNLMRTVESAQGYKFLKFVDPNNMYQDFIGIVENYSINKTSANLNRISLEINCSIKAPLFKWRTSCFFNVTKTETDFYQNYEIKNYKKYDFAYIDSSITDLKSSNINSAKNYTLNKIDNFWFAKNDISANTPFSLQNWTKDFIYENKYPFDINNSFDIFKLDFKNSFIQNIKHKTNSNVLKKFTLKYENIEDSQCLSMLFFLEKKSGYRRFIYRFPFLLNEYKVFICANWNHVFNYKNCNTLELNLIEEPNPNIFIDENDNYFLI